MAVSSIAVKVLVPVLLAGGGAVALVTAPEAAPAPVARLWIDSPLDGSRIDAGQVTVVAHAADALDLDAMALVVDGTEVARRTDLTAYDRLAGVQFDWKATDGYHFLVVTGGGLESAAVAVSVGEATGPGAPAPTPSATASATPTPSATASATPSTSATPVRPTRTPSPTKAPSAAPTTAAPPADPVIGVITISPNGGNIYGGYCTGPITVTAKVKNATAGSADVIGNGVIRNIGGNISGGTFTATFNQRDITGNNVTGDYQIEITVTNSTGFDVRSTDVSISCAKD